MQVAKIDLIALRRPMRRLCWNPPSIFCPPGRCGEGHRVFHEWRPRGHCHCPSQKKASASCDL